MTALSSSRTKVFISYSRKDAIHLKRLQVHFALYERLGLVDVWDDTKLAPGSLWREEIKKAIMQTKVAILLVSADFLASKFIAENELPPLLAAAQTEGAVILPVILSSCAFEDTELAQFQAVNSPAKPLLSMRKNEKEKIWNSVVTVVKDIMNAQQPQFSEKKSVTNLLPKEFESETELAQQIVINRPKHWEYLLTLELLKSKLAPIKRRLHDLKKGLVYKKTTVIRGDEFLNWSKSKQKDLVSLIKILANVLNEEISTAIGPPGVTGDPLEIKRAIDRLIFVCNEMVDWETEVHFAIALPPFETLKQKMEG
ncbi:MAG: toll/interleukin-1 receptor domain-containing protein [Ktedonobacteraceae bacterium]